MKKIAIIMNNFYFGGIELFFLNFFKSIDIKDYDISIVYSGKDNKKIIEEYKKIGINVIKLNHGLDNNRFKYMIDLHKLFKREKFDVVHANLAQNSFYPLMIAYFRKVKTRVLHSHMNMNGNKSNLLKRIVRKIKMKLSIMFSTDRIACSQIAGDSFFKKNYKIINNAMNIDNYTYRVDVREKLRSDFNLSNNKVYGYVGRITDEKNPMFALNIFDTIHKLDSDAKFYFIGYGDRIDQLKNEVINKPYISILDPVINISDYYCMFDALIFPSISEGLGMTAVEAQINSLPVLASDSVPVDTRISNFISYLPLSSSYDVWAKKLIELADTNKKDLKINDNIKNYDIRIQAKELFDIYNK